MDALNGPFQYAYNTQLHGFAWIMQPENTTLFQNFNTWLTGSHEGRPNWLDWFPVEEEVVKGLERDEKAVTVVDVGGGLGHELLGLRKKYPELPGRLVLQDLPETIKGVPETRVFEPTVHDFFTPQPVKGKCVLVQFTIHSFQILRSDIVTYRGTCLLLPQCLARLARR